MLANLLPGLRAVRAPLSAGYLWALVCWLLFEPVFPKRSDANGVVASLYRAGDVTSLVGLGIGLSFAAYLVGSISASTLTPLLRLLFPRSWPGPRRLRTSRSPLSPQAREALGQIARTTHETLRTSLALAGTSVENFLAKRIAAPSSTQRGRIFWQKLRRRIVSFVPYFKGRVRLSAHIGPGYAQPVDLDATQQSVLALAVLRDLPVVATTRLLGRDQELYSAVDRNRAEVEFRLAVIPPLLALAATLALGAAPTTLIILVVLAVVLTLALFSDGVRAERAANEILLDSIADRRVQSPSLERLVEQASALAARSRPEQMSVEASETALALEQLTNSLEEALRSEPGLALHAQKLAAAAKEKIEQSGEILPPPVTRIAEDALRLLSEITEAWVSLIDGHGMPALDPERQLVKARQRLVDYQRQARDAIDRARAAGETKSAP